MELTFKDVQNIELNILKVFHEYCKKNDLRYILGFGTLLGAVRHHGFIPWDNDIDVLMPRSDFERFLELSCTNEISKNTYVQHYSLDNKYHYICARVCDGKTHVNVPYIREQPTKLGLWIDIFPVDGVGKRSFKRVLQKVLLKWYWMLFRADVYGSTSRNSRTKLNYYVKKIALVLFPNRNNSHNYTIDKICKWFPFEDADDVSFMFGEEGVCKIPRSDFNELITMQFEDASFYCPPHYDEFLKQCYGDYMTLPKEEDRITHNIDVMTLD
jgi:lipopolysaccharide cholinephosphotransferase